MSTSPSTSKATSTIYISFVLHRSTIIYNTTYLTCLHPIRPHHCQHHHSPEHPFSQPSFSLFRTCTAHQHPQEVCGFPVKGHIFQRGAVMYLAIRLSCASIRPKRSFKLHTFRDCWMPECQCIWIHVATHHNSFTDPPFYRDTKTQVFQQ